jgi:branched-chain amino acid transport system substrate-binding protein
MSAPCAFILAVAALSAWACAPRAPLSPPAAQGRVEPVLFERPAAPADGALRLASIFPTLGRYALSGVQSHAGARLAVADVNRRGGVHGRRLHLLEYRTGSYFLDAGHAAALAASADSALAIVGSNASSLSRAISEVAESRGLVQVSNISTTADLTWDPASGRDRPFVFRVCPSDVDLSTHLASFAREHLRLRRVAVLYEVGRSYSAQLARGFVARFADARAGQKTREFVYLPLETDFRATLRDVQAFAPDAVFVPGSFTDTTLIALQAERLGLRTTLLGADGWSNRRLFARGGPALPAYHVDLCAPTPAFAERYRRAFGEESDGCRALLAYDAVLALVEALRALGPLDEADLGPRLQATRARLQRALRQVAFTGESGRLRFDEHGDVRRGVALMRVERRDGRYQSALERVLGES